MSNTPLGVAVDAKGCPLDKTVMVGRIS